MYQEFIGIEITSIASCVPKNRVGNERFNTLLTPKEMRLFEKTVGILERRWAEPSVTASDLGFAAADHLLKQYGKDIDCLIFLSQTPDYKIPFSSNILQAQLGLKREMLCLDINAGCAGFIQGLSTAFSIVSSLEIGSKALFIVAETMSKILSLSDRSTTMLFGDGASAVLIENTGNPQRKVFLNLFTDGAHANAIEIPDGGARNQTSSLSLQDFQDEGGNTRNKLQLAMDGAKVFDFTLREIVPGIQELLQKAGKSVDQIEYYLLHQSNQFIIRQIANMLQIPIEKMLLNIQHFGNTSGVSLPLLMNYHSNMLSESKSILLSGYGVGLNWGNCILENFEIKYNEIIEI